MRFPSSGDSLEIIFARLTAAFGEIGLPATGLGQRSVGQLEEENRRLRREVRHLAQQRDILKKRWASLPHRPAAI